MRRRIAVVTLLACLSLWLSTRNVGGEGPKKPTLAERFLASENKYYTEQEVPARTKEQALEIAGLSDEDFLQKESKGAYSFADRLYLMSFGGSILRSLAGHGTFNAQEENRLEVRLQFLVRPRFATEYFEGLYHVMTDPESPDSLRCIAIESAMQFKNFRGSEPVERMRGFLAQFARNNATSGIGTRLVTYRTLVALSVRTKENDRAIDELARQEEDPYLASELLLAAAVFGFRCGITRGVVWARKLNEAGLEGFPNAEKWASKWLTGVPEAAKVNWAALETVISKNADRLTFDRKGWHWGE